MGLVADAGPTAIPTFTGWDLKDSGSGNQVNALTGLTVTLGDLQIGPNLLWQKPIVGPMPTATYLAGTAGRPRNVLDDPFAVRGNRETTAGELMLTYDPTPATWMWAWDNDTREDADLAASLGLSVRRHHTTADAALFVAADGTGLRLHRRLARRATCGKLQLPRRQPRGRPTRAWSPPLRRHRRAQRRRPRACVHRSRRWTRASPGPRSVAGGLP